MIFWTIDRKGDSELLRRNDRERDAELLRLLFQSLEQKQPALGAGVANAGLQRSEPLAGFFGIAVACGGDELVEQGGGFASGHGGSWFAVNMHCRPPSGGR